MKKKPVVWYVDDLPANLERFEKNHGATFAIQTFSSPGQVLDALSKAKPDALLCDIFFYETPQIAEDMERKVQAKASEIRQFGELLGANRSTNKAGVQLIQAVSSRFGTTFPIYAYTSKGPYLLDELDFDHIGESGAKWLFKGKYGSATEQIIVKHDIDEFRSRNSFTMRAAKLFWVGLFGSGVLGGLVVWFLTEELPKLLGK